MTLNLSLVVAMIASALALSGCGFADSHSSLPGFMRAKEAEVSAPETPPDVKRLVSGKLDTVFASGSNPTHVEVSRPLHDPHGLGWTACVRADLNSVNGSSLGKETYRISISDDIIYDRRRIDPGDTCLTEKYEPV
jgi:hypothetical protein